jgi:hypothetical protein
LEWLYFNEPSKQYIKHIGKIKTLKRLRLGRLQLDEQSVQELVGLDALKSLECHHIVPTAIPYLEQFALLNEVSVTCEISRAEYEAFKLLSAGRIWISALNGGIVDAHHAYMPNFWRPPTSETMSACDSDTGIRKHSWLQN